MANSSTPSPCHTLSATLRHFKKYLSSGIIVVLQNVGPTMEATQSNETTRVRSVVSQHDNQQRRHFA
jgi:hypothetical protein